MASPTRSADASFWILIRGKVRQVMAQLFPFIRPTVIATVYGVVLLSTVPVVKAITNEFLRDVRNPSAEPDPVLRACAVVAIYIGFFACDALVAALLVGTLVIVVMGIAHEVARIYRRIRHLQGDVPRRPQPPANSQPIDIRRPLKQPEEVDTPDTLAA